MSFGYQKKEKGKGKSEKRGELGAKGKGKEILQWMIE
jgi:hypothetical protein